jgi:hypothetical protein
MYIDMFDGTFTLVKSFGDPAIPSTFSVFGIQDINGLVYVTYAVPNVGAGGYVDEFKEDGTFVKTLIQGLPLNQAWGVAAAPPNFGPLSNTLLVSNNSVERHHQCVRSDYREVCRTIRDERGKRLFSITSGELPSAAEPRPMEQQRVVRHRGSGDWHRRIGRHLCKNRLQRRGSR